MRHGPDFYAEHMLRRWDQFSPCSTSDIACRPYGAPFEDDSIAALDLLDSWLGRCEYHHDQCAKSLAGDYIDGFYPFETDAELPSRVLDIDTDTIRLVETQPGARGYYVTLSHCWGPAEFHPPKTTRANFNDRLKGMQLGSLPKTFRDAVKIARHIGVQYLWIDSLCIVQDARDDWRHESAKMGAIYESARLTIAAAGAVHSGMGCFVKERPALKDVRERAESTGHTQRSEPPSPPQITVSSKGLNAMPVTVHFAALPREEYNPYYSPLGYRAWACQEWYLSRRVIYFTKGGLSWQCKETQFNEREMYYDMHQQRDWAHLLERYSEAALSDNTDRLIAVQGVANQMSTIMAGQYHFGTWTHMPELLFWTMKQPEHHVEGPLAPTWSWGSREGPKFFWNRMRQFMAGMKDVTEKDLTVDEHGALTITAPILEVQVAPVPEDWNSAEQYFPERHGVSHEHVLIKSYETDDPHHHVAAERSRLSPDPVIVRSYRDPKSPRYFGSDFSPESVLIRLTRNAKIPAHFILDPNRTGAVAIGLAAPDRDLAQITGNIYCVFFLGTWRLFKFDIYGTGFSNKTEEVCRSVGRFHRELTVAQGEASIRLEGLDNEGFFWVLLVEAVKWRKDCFRRVGMGIIASCHLDGALYRRVSII